MAATLAWPTIAEIEGCEDVEACLRWHRFLPSPTNENQVTVINAVVARLKVLRYRDDSAYVLASKRLGWKL